MKLNKSNFFKEFRTGNYVKKWGEYIIRHRMWDSQPWQVVDCEDFDKASIVCSFHLREELWNYIK